MAYLNRGNVYIAKGDFDRGISDYTKAIEINPGYAEVYNNRGNAYIDKGDLDRGISDYNKAIEANPKFGNAYYNRAMAYFKKGRYSDSWDDLRRAQSFGSGIDPEFIEVLKKASGREE